MLGTRTAEATWGWLVAGRMVVRRCWCVTFDKKRLLTLTL